VRADHIDRLVARKIKELRHEHCLSQSDVADALGISFQQYQKNEKGIDRLSASKLFVLSCLFNIPVDGFYDEARQENCAKRGVQT